MNKKVIVVFMLLSLIGVVLASASFADNQVVLKYGELNPGTHMMTQVAKYFADLLKTQTNGRITMDIYPSGQLAGEDKTAIQAVQMGGIDMIRCNTNTLPDFGLQKASVFALPFMFRDRDHIWKVMNGPIGKAVFQEINDKKIHFVPLGWLEEGARDFFFAKVKVSKVGDMNGLKIRVPQDKMMMATIKAFGASPTPISFSELYSSLQTGVIDGAEQPPAGYLSGKFYEVGKYYTLDHHTYSPSIIIISESKWNSFSKQDQKIIMDCIQKEEAYNREQAQKLEDSAFADMKKGGAVISDVTDRAAWQNAVKPVYDEFGANIKDLITQVRNTK